MIIDSLVNASKSFAVHELFEKAFDYINSVNLETIEVGKYEIDGEDLRAIVSDKNGVAAADSVAKFECHDKHIDIQLCIRGNEQIGWKPRNSCTAPKNDYNPEKDVCHYGDTPDIFFNLTNQQFAIFFPDDVHAPMIAVDDKPIKKMVIKVKL